MLMINIRYPLPRKFNTDLVVRYGNDSKNMRNESGIGIALNASEFVFDTSISTWFVLNYFDCLYTNTHLSNISTTD